MWSVAVLLGILIHEPGAPVELGEQRIAVRIHGRVAEVEFTQVLTSAGRAEAAYEFFVPEGARVIGFSVDGTEGVFSPYDSKNELYPSSYAKRTDKGLLCLVVRDFYRATILLDKMATFTVRYRVLAPGTLKLPLGAPRVSVSVDGSAENLRCTSHEAKIDGPKAAWAGPGGKDLVLTFDAPKEGGLPAGQAVDGETALRVGTRMDPPRSFLGRAVRWRASRLNIRAGGGSGQTENAVELGLYWLAAKRTWGNDETTALCLLAFLSTGYTDRGNARDNRYAGVVRDAVDYLLRARRAKGALKTEVLRTLALAELYWMVRDPKYREPVQEGLRRVLPKVDWDGDAETAAWAAQLLRVAEWSGLSDDGARKKAKEAFRLEPNDPASLLAHVYLGGDPKEAVWKHDIARLEGAPLFFATHAMFHGDVPRWRAWNKKMKVAVVSTQAPKRHEHEGSWGNDIERTAYGCLTLEVYYRFPRTRLPLR